MAQTEKGIIYPFDYNEVADVPADFKALAESIDVLLNDYSLNTESGNKIVLEMNNTTYKIKAVLKDKDDNVISTSNEIDLPLENMVTNISYNDKTLTLTHQDGQTTEVSIADLIRDLASKEEVEELQSQVDDLTTLVETELESNEVEGTEIDVSDSAEYRGKMEVKGNTYQKQLSGKNLWGGFSYSRTASGVTHIYNKDGTFTINGTATANSDSLISSAAISEGIYKTFPAGTYTISGGTSEVLLYVIRTNGNAIANTSSTTFTKSFTLTEETDLFIRSRVNEGVTVNNATVYCMVESGSTATDYEQYCGGASPNPEFPQNIEVVTGDNVVKHVGKNLLNIYTIVKGRLDNGVIGYVSDTSELTKNENNFSFTTTTGYRGVTSDYIKINNENIFVFSSTTSNNNYNISVACYDQNKNYLRQATINGLTNNSRSIEILDDTKYIRIYFYLSNAGSITIDKPQLEEGSTPTSYEPCIEEEYELELWKENEFDSENANVLNAYFSEDGKMITSSNKSKTLYIPCKANCTYKITKKLSARFRLLTTNVLPNISVIGDNYIFGDLVNCLKITTGSNAKYLCVFFYNSDYDTLTVQEILDSIQIQESIELCKIGNYQDILFKNVVGDENYNAELESGAWYKKKAIDKKVLDDSWTWFNNATNRFSVEIAAPNGDYVLSALCDKYINALNWTAHTNTDKSFIVRNGDWGANKCRISFLDSYYASLAEWTQFVSENNLIVYHRLLNPTYEKITDSTLISQLEALKKAKWIKGINHWWTETDNLEPVLKGTYKQSNNLRIKEQDERLDNLESRLALLE